MSTPPPVRLSPLHVIVPVRSIASGKARLGGALDAEERQELVLGMLRRTLASLLAWPASERVLLVTPDPELPSTDARVVLVRQSGDGLNEGVDLGRRRAQDLGANAVLVLPADLPGLHAASLDRMLEAADAALAAGNGAPLVVIAPSDARQGTNALLLAPPDVIPPRFGIASFEAHVRAAAAAGASVQVVTDPALGFDLDTPEDVEMLSQEDLAELMRLGQAAAAGW
jgi:2-phospho-L-lactate guanylyltransferase